MRYSTANERGFTLVEVMIVVAIIALLAAIAIPNLLRARHNANQTAAVAALRTISTAQESYRAAQIPVTYGTFALLIGANPPYLNMTENPVGTIPRQGYNHVLAGADANSFCVTGTPQVANTTGTNIYVVDSAGVVYGSSGGNDPACSGATPFQCNANCTALE